MAGGYAYSSLLDVQYSPLTQETDKGVESEIFLTQKEIEILQNLPKQGYNGGNNGVNNGYTHMIKEEIEGIYAFQTVVEGYIYVLIPTDPKQYNYERFYWPEKAVYLDYHPGTSKVKWIGYRKHKYKGSGAGLALLKWFTHYHCKKDIQLDVVLERKTTDSNPLCKLYEGLGYRFVEFLDRQEGFYAHYLYKQPA